MRDAESVEPLRQLRAALTDDGYRAWLRRPNDLLDGKTPMSLIQGGRLEVVADLASNMLTGNPT